MIVQPKTLVVNDFVAINGRGSANLTGVVGAGTMTSEWLDLLELRTVSFNIVWTAVAATAGTISFEGTNDPAQASTSIVTCPPTVILGNAGSLVTAAAASAIVCNFTDVMRFMRYKNVQTAGGGVGQFSGWAIARAM